MPTVGCVEPLGSCNKLWVLHETARHQMLLCRRDIAVMRDGRPYLWGSERQRLHLKADPGGVSPSWAEAIAQVNQLHTNIATLYIQQQIVAYTHSEGQYLHCKCPAR